MQRPNPIQGFKKFVNRKKPAIKEVLREPTAGGVVFRRNPKKNGAIEILLIQDAKDRWTIPKGHIEEGETAKQTAAREITERSIEIAGNARATIATYAGVIDADNIAPGGIFCIRRPRSATNRSASSRLRTPARQAATYSPMLCPIIAWGVMPQDCHSRARA